MTETKTYNGWTNYETWCVNLWMDNEEGSQRYWSEVAQEVFDGAEPRYGLGRDAIALSDLAERLKYEHDEAMPGMAPSVWADMLGAAFDEVNWREIAEGLLESVNGYPTEQE